MPAGLKKELGLGDPNTQKGSTEQADKFKAAFQAASSKINECLQYTAAYAQKAKHDPQAAKRDKLCQAYQVALQRIDPTNPAKAQSAIDQVLASAKELQASTEALKAAAEKAYTAWTARQGDLEKVTDQIREMVEWGHDKAPALQQVVDAITAKANERAYEEALTALEQLLSKAGPIYEDYTKQKAAQEKYEPGLAELQLRLDSAQSCTYKPLETDKQAMGTAAETMKQAATAKNYVDALSQLEALKSNVEAFEGKVAELEEKKTKYEAARKDLEPRLAEASKCGFTKGTEEHDQKITDATSKTDAAVAEENYDEALTQAEQLTITVDDKLARVAELEEMKAAYESRYVQVQPRLADASSSDARYPDLDAIKLEVTSIQTEMETAAKAEDYEQAVHLIGDLEAKLDELDAAIEAKKKEYETARGQLNDRISKAKACTYKPLEAQRQEIENGLKPIDDAAASGDYPAALQLVKDLGAKVDAFEAARTKIDDELKAKINSKLPNVKSVLAGLSDATSPIKGNVERLIASIESALSSSNDLEQAVKDVEEAAKQIGELQQVHEIRKRLDDKWDINKDGEARKIIEELEASGKLAGLPMEARNALVDELMDGYLSEDDDAAMQKIFKIPAIDRRFEEKDKATRDKIVKAYTENEEVKKIRADWSTMTEAQKKEAVKKLTQIPVGPDGWNVGMPSTFDYTNAPKDSNGNILFGTYSYGDDAMSINLHNDAAINSTDPSVKDPIELLDTIAHEMGHKYQRKLIDDLEAGRLKPGDAEYEQARAFQQHEQYKQRSPDGFKKIYSTSPKEAHSRVMGSEIRRGLEGGGSGTHHH
jgi:chromosome segregation ATPase